MEFHLSPILSSSNDYQIVNHNKQKLVRFGVYPEYNDYSEEQMRGILVSYVKKFDFLPLYIHIVSSNPTNFSSDNSTTEN